MVDMVEDDNHDDGDTGRALVETEPVRYQLEEIHLTLDKEDSEKVTILIMMMMVVMNVMTVMFNKRTQKGCSSVLMP